jgi:hypothetical protein
MNRYIIKNNGGTLVFVSDLGLIVPASGSVEIPQRELFFYRGSTDLADYITAGTLVINDGTADFDAADGLAHIQDDLKTSKLVELSYITRIPDVRATANSTLSLTKTSPNLLIFTGTTAGQIVKLPSAISLIKAGRTYEIHNNSTVNISIQNNAAALLATVKPNQRAILAAQTVASAAGVWSVILVDNQVGGTNGIARFILGYSFDGTAGVGRWLELGGNNPSDGSPYVCAEPCTIIALSISASSTSTGVTQVTKNGTTNVITSLTITGARTAYTAGLNIPLVAGDTLGAKVSSGSIARPTFNISMKVTG